jgi:hypothetical protein
MMAARTALAKAQREALYPYLKRAKDTTATRTRRVAGPDAIERAARVAAGGAEGGVAHSRAIAAGCPASLPMPGPDPHGKRGLGSAEVNTRIALALKERGLPMRFAVIWPGAAGHERCRRVCVTYLPVVRNG